jgi:ABC-type uncharacterized transport system substrate-binding protein
MYAVSGGLMSCGIDVNEPYRQAAAYVDRILKGAKPGELPVQAGAGRFQADTAVGKRTSVSDGLKVESTEEVASAAGRRAG